jgi:hypothetical protein
MTRPATTEQNLTAYLEQSFEHELMAVRSEGWSADMDQELVLFGGEAPMAG